MRTRFSKKTVGLIFILSGIYLILSCILLYFVHSPALPLMGIIFTSYISWRNGTLAGLLLTVLNHMCNGLAFRFMAPEFFNKFSHEMIISIIVNTGISFLLGYFGKLAYNLHEEVERRKKIEASLLSLQNELEQRVEMRTRELEKANELLYQARKMETIGHISGTIAHDFNNFLSIILGYSSLIAKTLDSQSPAREYAKIIENTAQTAAELTAQLLVFARKKKFSFQQVNLNDLTKEMMPLLSSVVKHGIQIVCIEEPNLPVFMGGVDQIKSAILNLCINARDAMKDGGTLTISTKTVLITQEFCGVHNVNCSEGTYSAVAITDTGTGIKDDVLAHLFEPFFTTKEIGKGTGMGLAAVYGIMQSHKGAVLIKTELGKGSTFTMLFPVEKSNNVQQYNIDAKCNLGIKLQS